MACPRCGTDCNCACSGDPLPSQDWRRQVSLQVRAHKVRKRRRLDPDAPLLEFDEQDVLAIEPDSARAVQTASTWRWDGQVLPTGDDASTVVDAQYGPLPERYAQIAVEEPPQVAAPEIVESKPAASYLDVRPPLPPFPRISASFPKIIEFPRPHTRHYELAEPVADQLRIFEAVEELPPPAPNHLSEIEIAPQEPAYFATEIEVPIQTAPLGLRAYAAAVDGVVMIGAVTVFAVCAQFFATSLPMTKPLLGSGAACLFLLLTIYYVLSLSLCRTTAGMEASGLRVITFAGDCPSLNVLRWRALATVLSYAALGMGFGWALIDEDRLCWHDRITHTYLTSK